MYKINFNGQDYKTNFKTSEYRFGYGLSLDVHNKVKKDFPNVKPQDKMLSMYPFTEVRVDGRDKNIRKLKYFSWILITL